MKSDSRVEERAFDYVVVGAGAAGCVVAARLSEDGRARVALLEDGGAGRSPLVAAPLAFGRAVADPRLTWRIETPPQPELDGRVVALPRGRLLGGTSAVNGMIHTRGAQADFDAWAAAGCAGWSHDELRPCFERSERSLAAAEDGAMPRLGDAPPLARVFIEAAGAAGLDGAAPPVVSIRNGRRVSSAAYLRAARGRANLSVVTGCRAERVVIENRRATGVEARIGGRAVLFAARREVLLCAGAVHSPHLLFRSGVGDGVTLRAAGLPVVHHLPGVGRNLQDHFGAHVAWASERIDSLNTLLASPLALAGAGLKWALLRRGPLARPLAEAILFADSTGRGGPPDVEVLLRAMDGSAARGVARTSAFSCFVYPLRPQSRGAVAPGGGPDAAPVVQPNYLSAAEDRATLLRGLRLARRIAAAEPLAGLAEREIAPGAAAQDDRALEAHVRRAGASASHLVGSCRMGVGGDAVVDPALRVRGLEAIRVIDASIMPHIVSAHPNATVLAIGEKGAALVMSRR